MKFKDFYKQLKRFRILQETSAIINNEADKVLTIQRMQLMKGEGVDGRPLSPKISQDPYFKSPESAKRYADWKHQLYPETPYDVANLTITGYYHNSLSLTATITRVQYDAGASFSNSIAAKYGNKQLGLNDDSLTTAWNKVVKPSFITIFTYKVGGTI